MRNYAPSAARAGAISTCGSPVAMANCIVRSAIYSANTSSRRRRRKSNRSNCLRASPVGDELAYRCDQQQIMAESVLSAHTPTEC